VQDYGGAESSINSAALGICAKVPARTFRIPEKFYIMALMRQTERCARKPRTQHIDFLYGFRASSRNFSITNLLRGKLRISKQFANGRRAADRPAIPRHCGRHPRDGAAHNLRRNTQRAIGTCRALRPAGATRSDAFQSPLLNQPPVFNFPDDTLSDKNLNRRSGGKTQHLEKERS
jgi:hypothetical protein